MGWDGMFRDYCQECAEWVFEGGGGGLIQY